MVLKEMNLNGVPNKLPSFMMKYGNEMIDIYLEDDYDLMEEDPNELLKVYKLTKSSNSDSYVYLDSIQHKILQIFSDSELVYKLCSDQRLFVQAIKAVPTEFLLTELYFVVSKNGSVPSFNDFTVYDFAITLNYITLLVCMKNREDEIIEHCDIINDYIEKTYKVSNNINYESVRKGMNVKKQTN